MTPEMLRIGSRDSPLALAQTRQVMTQLQDTWPGLQLELKTFKTKGDIILDTSLSQVGDKGLFVKELEIALLNNEIDLAIHSLKDMPGKQPEGLALQSVGQREDPRDVLLSPGHILFRFLNPGALVGTSSLRRVAQFKRLRDDLEYQNIRGNLQTRLRKLEEGQYQAIILAAAGVHRLGWKPRIAQYFDPITESIPAVGQGILAVEFREADQWVQEKLAPLALPAVQAAMQAERAMLRTLEGGCQVPIGGYAKPQDEAGTSFVLHGIVLDLDGTRAIKCELPFEPANAEATGIAAAHQLMAEGAEDILNSLATRGI